LFEEGIKIYNKYTPNEVVINKREERILPMSLWRQKEYEIEKTIREEQNVIGMGSDYEEEEELQRKRKRSTSTLDYLTLASQMFCEEQRKEDQQRVRNAKCKQIQEEATIETNESIDSKDDEETKINLLQLYYKKRKYCRHKDIGTILSSLLFIATSLGVYLL